MPPEVLIVGDTRRRRELLDQVRSLRYGVALCRPRDLRRHLDEEGRPAAILICSGDTDAELLLDNLRSEPSTRDLPVVLVGPYADDEAQDMGADAALSETSGGSAIRALLSELAGPASGHTETVLPVPEDAERTGGRRRETTGWGDGPEETPAPDTARGQPVLAHLHETLDRLEARLADTSLDDDVIDDDLIDMSPDDVPEVDTEVPQRRSNRRPRPRRSSSADELDVAAAEHTQYDGGERSVPRRAESSDTATRNYERTDRIQSGRVETNRRETGRRDATRPEPARAEPPRREPARRESARTDARERSAVLRARRPRAPGESDNPVGADRSARPAAGTVGDAARPAGTIAATPVYEELWRLHQDRFSGRLDIRRRRARKSIWFADGEPVFSQSNVNGDRLVDRLLRRGVLTRAQYETARRLAAKAPRRAGQLLVEAGFLKPRELHAMLREQLARMIESTFSWTDGDYGLAAGDAVDEAVLLDYPVELLVVQGLRDALEVPTLSAKLGPRTRCPRLLSGHDPQGLGERLRLSEELVELLEEIDGQRSIAQCLAVPGRDEQEMLALFVGLLVVGALELLEPGELDGGEDPVALDRLRLSERLALVRRTDYFAVLGVPRDASKAEIRQAFRELEETFSDQSLETEILRDNAIDVAELRFALQEAAYILLDDALRSAYLAHLGDPEPTEETEAST